MNSFHTTLEKMTKRFLIAGFCMGIFLAMSSSVFAAAPIVVTATSSTADTNNDGTVDQLTITFSEVVDINDTSGIADGLDSITLGDSCTIANGDYTSDDAATLVLTLTGCTAGDTSITPSITYATQSGCGNNFAICDGTPTNEMADGAQLPPSDGAKPVLTAVTFANSTYNTVTFTYSESVVITDGASTTSLGDVTTAGTIAGLGTFATGGTITVPTLKNAISGNGTANITVALAAQSGGYIATSTTTITAPSGNVTPLATPSLVDAAGNQANSAAAVVAPGVSTAWDTTRPTISSAILSDTYFNNAAFVAGGTFNTGTDGKADTMTITASETLRTSTDAAGTRNDWSVTGAANEYGTSITVIKGAGSGTTYTINFSGVNTYYDAGTFEVLNTQDTAPSFIDAAGNPLASGKTSETYKACYTGYSCASGTIGNVAVITNSIQQPGGDGSGVDSTAPGSPSGLTATVNDNMGIDLVWIDPSDSDISSIRIYRKINEEVESMIRIVNKGTEKYEDTFVEEGDVVKYALSSTDLTGNESAKSSYVQITVELGATAEEIINEEADDSTLEEDTTPEEETTDENVEEEVVESVVLTDINNHWAKERVQAMVQQGIVKGDPDGAFRPDDNLNRAEASALLYRVLGLDEPTNPATVPFSDVATDSWYAGYIAYLKSIKVVNGNPDGIYLPATDINRAEFLALAMRTYHYSVDEATQTEIEDLRAGDMTEAYEDLADEWYTADVTAATGLGFIGGRDCEGGKCFAAEATITRAEATKILYEMFYTMLSAEDATTEEEEATE